ncbi:S1 family peptidase [Saccharothrix sp. Mg75]|uniref:S1 family peptidase n=1 Tax=Saccharothrix sp. Mg75 TaxID=3445357 RepID=UPI003EEDF81D
MVTGHARPLESWRARVRSPGGEVLGAGVLLGDRHVLTCAHVLTGADGHPGVDLVGPRGWLVRRARPVPGCVVPPMADQRGDVALLELDEPVPPGSGTTLRRAAVSWNRPVRAFGFPGSLVDGVWTQLTLAGEAGPGREWIQLNLQPGWPPVRTGFSGAGVAAVDTGEVLGVVVSTLGPTTGVSWMLPVETILAHVERVERWTVGDRGVDPHFSEPSAERVDVPTTRHVVAWLSDARRTMPLLLVGADLAALSRVVLLASRELGPSAVGGGVAPQGTVPPLGSVDLAVDATGRTADEVTKRVVERAAVRADAGSRLPPMTVVIGAVDDAGDPEAVVERVAVPLVRDGTRVILAFTRDSSPALDAARRWRSGLHRERLGVLAERIAGLDAAERAAAALCARVAPAGLVVPHRASRMRFTLSALRRAPEDEAAVVDLEHRVERAARLAGEARAWLDAALTEVRGLGGGNGRGGLLSAHKARAVGAGLAEDLALSGLYRTAFEVLTTPPVDPAAAAAAVDAYGRAVQDRLDGTDDEEDGA